MGDPSYDRGHLSIPSFASERCRAMTTELIRALEGIPPKDDQALEDRALACFVVACGELALMQNVVQRDTVVEQLTLVGRKLVSAGAAGAAEGKPVKAGVAAAESKLAKADAPAAEPIASAAKDRAEVQSEVAQDHAAQDYTAQEDVMQGDVTQDNVTQGDMASHMGMTWEQLEAVLKQEKKVRETSMKLTHSFP